MLIETDNKLFKNSSFNDPQHRSELILKSNRDYTIEIRGSRRFLRPSEELVHWITTRLTEDSPSSGFAILKGLPLTEFSVLERKVFQKILFSSVCEHIREFKNGGDTPILSDRTYYRHFSTKDGFLPSSAKAVEHSGLRWTVKELHYDPNAIFFAHGYGPVKNVIGGDLLIIRVRDFCTENNLELMDLLDHFVEAGQSYPTIKKKFLDHLVSQYSVTLNTGKGEDPIVFINNTVSTGVAHGATPVSVINPNEPFSRHYYRTSIK